MRLGLRWKIKKWECKICYFDHSFAHNFFLFHFVVKLMLEFRENVMFFRIVQKSSNYNYLSRKKVLYFAAPEVDWCLRIVGQAAKATYIRVRNNFASLRIVDGSGAVFRMVASSDIKAVELDVQWWLISTSNCFSSCFLHAPVGDPFYERCNAFNRTFNTYILYILDVLLCSIAEYFYELCRISASP